MGDIATQVVDTLRDNLSGALDYLINNALGAVIVLILGIVVAWAVKTVIVRGLNFLQVKKYTDAAGLNKVITKDVEVVELLGDIAKWVVLLSFIIVALDVADLSGVNDLLRGVLAYLPNVAKAIVLLFIAVVVADLASRVVKASATSIGVKASEILSDIARWSIIIAAFLAALQQLGIAVGLINILFQGIVALIAIAGGLAFGLGGKDAATDVINTVKKNFPKK